MSEDGVSVDRRRYMRKKRLHGVLMLLMILNHCLHKADDGEIGLVISAVPCL